MSNVGKFFWRDDAGWRKTDSKASRKTKCGGKKNTKINNEKNK